jgi:hypothetical protein
MSATVRLLGVAGLAIAALSAGEVRAGVNPWAGKFRGRVPGVYGTWSISIKGAGKVTGAIHEEGVLYLDGAFAGSVDRTGRLTCSGYEWIGQQTGEGFVLHKVAFALAASTTVDSAGDIVGTTDGGVAFTWTRQ